MQIHMCSLHVTDPGHAHRFYTNILGFDTLMAVPEHNVFVLAAPGQDVGLLLEPSDNPIAEQYRQGLYDSGMPVMVLRVENLDTEIERLTAAGVTFVGSRFSDASGDSINFDDSVGNILQLHQPS